MTQPLFSIIIPTYKRNDLLRLCLDRLAPHKQTISQATYEVIVSDDGSIMEQCEIIDDYQWVKWVEGPHKGPAANRNNGVKYSKGEWLIFLDDDCIPEKGLLEAYKKSIDANSSKVYEGRIYVDEPRYSLGITSPVNLNGGYLWSCNFLIHKNLFLELSGFDERFPFAAMEDVDLKLRIEKSGYSIEFVEDASVCHPWRKKGGWKKVMQHNYSSFVFLEKHPEERKRINSKYYLKLVARTFLYDTLPGIFKYKGRGLLIALIEHVAYLKMAAKLLLGKEK